MLAQVFRAPARSLAHWAAALAFRCHRPAPLRVPRWKRSDPRLIGKWRSGRRCWTPCRCILFAWPHLLLSNMTICASPDGRWAAGALVSISEAFKSQVSTLMQPIRLDSMFAICSFEGSRLCPRSWPAPCDPGQPTFRTDGVLSRGRLPDAWLFRWTGVRDYRLGDVLRWHDDSRRGGASDALLERVRQACGRGVAGDWTEAEYARQTAPGGAVGARGAGVAMALPELADRRRRYACAGGGRRWPLGRAERAV